MGFANTFLYNIYIYIYILAAREHTCFWSTRIHVLVCAKNTSGADKQEHVYILVEQSPCMPANEKPSIPAELENNGDLVCCVVFARKRWLRHSQIHHNTGMNDVCWAKRTSTRGKNIYIYICLYIYKYIYIYIHVQAPHLPLTHFCLP